MCQLPSRTPPEFLELLIGLAQQLVQLLQGAVKVGLKGLCWQGPQLPDLGLQVCLSLLQGVPPCLNGLQLPLLVLHRKRYGNVDPSMGTGGAVTRLPGAMCTTLHLQPPLPEVEPMSVHRGHRGPC